MSKKLRDGGVFPFGLSLFCGRGRVLFPGREVILAGASLEKRVRLEEEAARAKPHKSDRQQRDVMLSLKQLYRFREFSQRSAIRGMI